MKEKNERCYQPQFLRKMSMIEFINYLDDYGASHITIHEASWRLKKLQIIINAAKEVSLSSIENVPMRQLRRALKDLESI